MVQLELETTLLSPGSLRLREVTPAYNAGSSPYGWGTPNAARSSVDKFIVSLSVPGATRPFTYETGGTLSGALASGDFVIHATDLLLAMPSCTCQLQGTPAFKSGCLNLSVQAIDYQTVSRLATNFTVHLSSRLPDCGMVWVRKEGRWTNVTAEGKQINNSWQWQVLDSYEDFTDWKLEVNNIPIQIGTVLRQVTGTIALSRDIALTVGEGSVALFITATERKAWSDKMARLLRGEGSDCGCVDINNYKPCPPDDCREGKLAFIGQQLDILEGIQKNEFSDGLAIDCQSAMILLKRVQASLRAWQ